MSEFTIRPGESIDIEAAIAVYLAANDARRGGEPTPLFHIERVRGSLQRPQTTFLVAQQDDRCVGMALAFQAAELDGAGPPIPELCHISMIFVAPDRWGLGIGSALVEAVLTTARERGYRRAQLWTHRSNTRAQRLYERLGFTHAGREKLDDLNQPIILYQCALD